MTKFQYKIVVLATSRELVEKELNKLGQDKWELVSIDFDTRTYVLKKMIMEI